MQSLTIQIEGEDKFSSEYYAERSVTVYYRLLFWICIHHEDWCLSFSFRLLRSLPRLSELTPSHSLSISLTPARVLMHEYLRENGKSPFLWLMIRTRPHSLLWNGKYLNSPNCYVFNNFWPIARVEVAIFLYLPMLYTAVARNAKHMCARSL